MKEYVKPSTEMLDEKAEGVFAASGDDGAQEGSKKKTECRFGFKFCNPHRDPCQVCSATGGATTKKVNGDSHPHAFSSCPDDMPIH